MSLSIDNKYNAHLRQIIAEMDASPAEVANQPEMIYGGARVRKTTLNESLPYAPPLVDVLEAEDQLSVGSEMSGGNILGDVKKGFKKTTKAVSKAGKSVEKGAKKISKSKVGKAVGKVGKKAGTMALDGVAGAAGAAGAALGTSAAIALGQPELVPVAAAIGSKLADEAGKSGRKYVKKQTGMGAIGKEKVKRPPSKWNLHVKEYHKANGGSFKDAMKNAKATYNPMK